MAFPPSIPALLLILLVLVYVCVGVLLMFYGGRNWVEFFVSVAFVLILFSSLKMVSDTSTETSLVFILVVLFVVKL